MIKLGLLCYLLTPIYGANLDVNESFAPYGKISKEIISGLPAQIEEFPYQVGLHILLPVGPAFCGGSLIASRWVLTAAHCTERVITAVAVFGVVALDDSRRVTAQVRYFIAHPLYVKTNLANDIALAKLQTPVFSSSLITYIPLSPAEIRVGIFALVSGWGQTNDTEHQISNTLNYVALVTISNEMCNNTYKIIEPGIVCALGINFQSTCSGDSGGPLVVGFGKRAIQIGVVSFGHKAGCTLGYPVGFTRVDPYISWIKYYTKMSL